MPTATLLVSCPDQKGLVAKLSNFIYSYDGLHADHPTDLEPGLFLSRLEWDLEGFRLERSPALPAASRPTGSCIFPTPAGALRCGPASSPTVCWI